MMILIIAVILLIVAIIISYIESENIIVKPLKQIQQMAARIADGDITQDASVKIMNDIGQTAVSLNTAQAILKNLLPIFQVYRKKSVRHLTASGKPLHGCLYLSVTYQRQ